jgi:hypothetical protein
MSRSLNSSADGDVASAPSIQAQILCSISSSGIVGVLVVNLGGETTTSALELLFLCSVIWQVVKSAEFGVVY